jgi:ubiquinone/menaquinone biosynthesis C-methylase UbiE
MPTHRDRVLEQFTRQAEPFSKAPSITDQAALTKIVAATGAGPSDDVLDVACGPGIACAFARIARHVTGIDLTPAMIDRARSLAVDNGLANRDVR